MPLDNRWYMHPKDCQCPECEWRRQHKHSPAPTPTVPDKQPEVKQHNPPPKLPPKLPQTKGKNSNKWLIFLVIIACLIIVAPIINHFIGSLIPFWILLSFLVLSFIPKRRIPLLGKLILNLGILSLLGFIIWSGIELFSQRFLSNAIIGSITFVAECVLFFWMGNIISRFSRQRPSMRLTVFCIISVSLVLAFAGVQPLAFGHPNSSEVR